MHRLMLLAGFILAVAVPTKTSLGQDALEGNERFTSAGQGRFTASSGPMHIFWTELVERCRFNKIRRAHVDGTAFADLVTLDTPDSPIGLAIDDSAGKLYWTLGGSSQNCDDRIQRANLDGTDIETLVIFEGDDFCVSPTPSGIALDRTHERMYWILNGGCSPCPSCGACDLIQRADLDGSSFQKIIVLGPVSNPDDIALDLNQAMMYWSDRQYPPSIQRADLDGSNIQPLFTSPHGVTDLALDLEDGKIYWIILAGLNSRIQRANLDGSFVEDLIVFEEFPDFDPSQAPRGLAVDAGNGKMYWSLSRFCPFGDGEGRIQRANLDGSDVEDILVGLDIPITLTLGGADDACTDGDGDGKIPIFHVPPGHPDRAGEYNRGRGAGGGRPDVHSGGALITVPAVADAPASFGYQGSCSPRTKRRSAQYCTPVTSNVAGASPPRNSTASNP